MSAVAIKLGGPRMDELAQRFAADFLAAEELRFASIETADDIDEGERASLILRIGVSTMAVAIENAARVAGLPQSDVTTLALINLGAVLRRPRLSLPPETQEPQGGGL